MDFWTAFYIVLIFGLHSILYADFWPAFYVVYVLCLVSRPLLMFEQLLLVQQLLSQQLGLNQRQHVLLVVRMRAAAAA